MSWRARLIPTSPQYKLRSALSPHSSPQIFTFWCLARWQWSAGNHLWLLSLVTWILPTVNGVTVAGECAVEVNMTQTIEQLNNSAITCRYSGHDCSVYDITLHFTRISAFKCSLQRAIFPDKFSPLKSRNTNDVFSWANELWKLSFFKK